MNDYAEWEYRILELTPTLLRSHERELNKNGEYGWELVTIIYRPGLSLVAYFKRPKP